MSDFIAHITAELDAGKVEQRLNDLTKKRVIDIELNLTNSINDLINKQLSGLGSGVGKAGVDVGKAFSDAFYKQWFAKQKTIADTAKNLEVKYPTAKSDSKADDFYKRAAQAELAQRKQTQAEIERMEAADNARVVKQAQQEAAERIAAEQKYQTERARLQAEGQRQEQQVAAQRQQQQQQYAQQYEQLLQKQELAQRKQIENFQQSFSSGKYSSNSSTMEKQLSNFAGQQSEALNRAKAALTEYKATLSDIQDHYNPENTLKFDDATLVGKFKNLEQSAERYKNAMKEVTAETTKTLAPGVAMTKSNQILQYMNENTKAVKKYGTALKDLAQQAANATTKADLDNINQQFATLRSNITSEGLTGKSFIDEALRGFKQIGQFVATYGILQKIPQVVQKMASEVVKVDSAMTELRKVADASDAELSQSFDRATASAKQYGIAISDVINSQSDWKRLGYELPDAQNLADLTTLLQRVGDNMTQESAATGIISAMQGFSLEPEDAAHIVDVYNEVANNFAIDTAGIADAISRSASSMKAAGNTMEETVALVAAANAVVQDPDSIGTAFKTISMRIRGAKTELEDAGLETEGMVDSVAKLRQEVKALTDVDIMENDDTFKSTYDILDELSQKWQDLTDIQQASVTELIAGKRQGNIVSALMNNFDQARKALDKGMNSDGSAVKELENYQKGIEFSIGRLQASFQQLSTTLIKSDIFKGLIDGANTAVEALTKLVSVFGNLQTVVAGGFIAKGITTLVKNFDKPMRVVNISPMFYWSIKAKKQYIWRLQQGFGYMEFLTETA